MSDLYDLDAICKKCPLAEQCIESEEWGPCAAAMVLDALIEAIEEGLNDAVKYL